MISGRGFIGIAAQSLGMGRPVLPPIWALIFGAASAVGCGAGLRKAPAAGYHAALRHQQIVGLMLAGISYAVMIGTESYLLQEMWGIVL